MTKKYMDDRLCVCGSCDTKKQQKLHSSYLLHFPL